MSKITNVRLPNATSFRFDPQQFNQLVRSLEQVILQLNATYTPVTTEDKDQAQSWFFSGANIVSRQEVNNKVSKSGDTMTGNLTVPTLNATSVVLGSFTIQQTAGKLTFLVAGNPIGSLDTSGNFTVIGNVTGFGTP
jgi:hypothetical protein